MNNINDIEIKTIVNRIGREALKYIIESSGKLDADIVKKAESYLKD